MRIVGRMQSTHDGLEIVARDRARKNGLIRLAQAIEERDKALVERRRVGKQRLGDLGVAQVGFGECCANCDVGHEALQWRR